MLTELLLVVELCLDVDATTASLAFCTGSDSAGFGSSLGGAVTVVGTAVLALEDSVGL
jgi:hypothetical protein